MKYKPCILAVVALLAFALSAESARAQQGYNRPSINSFFNILSRPTVSPYLNLLRPQGLGAPNYQTLVRPELEARRALRNQQESINRLQGSLRQQQQQLRQAVTGELRPTGHRTLYLNYSHYYPALSSQ